MNKTSGKGMIYVTDEYRQSVDTLQLAIEKLHKERTNMTSDFDIANSKKEEVELLKVLMYVQQIECQKLKDKIDKKTIVPNINSLDDVLEMYAKKIEYLKSYMILLKRLKVQNKELEFHKINYLVHELDDLIKNYK